MSDVTQLNRPWLVAVWPGMGQVAMTAGYYLMSKLSMHHFAEFPASGLFDVDYALIKGGRVRKTERPRSRLFLKQSPPGERDILLFIGEAQPPLGKYAFCERLIDFARDQGVERVFTFAAMATDMHPEQPSRVFGAATDDETFQSINRPDVSLLEEGHIGGLNGVLLGTAADKGMPGICLLGEMPQVFSQVPFPKASLGVLRVFIEMAGNQLDFRELEQQSEAMEHRLGEVLSKVKQHLESAMPREQDEDFYGSAPEEGLDPADKQRIEKLFQEASEDRAKAYELKSELDRLDVFTEYEDRFLDLFSQAD